MACGAGMYMDALIATVLLLVALQIVGAMEGRLGWKRFPMLYEVRAEVGPVMGRDVVGAQRAEELAEKAAAARLRMHAAMLKVLDSIGQPLRILQRDSVAGMERVSFAVTATGREHDRVLSELKASDATDQVVAFPEAEVD
jgi:putative Mg2+ transporter-C (MgtC) family protein